MEKLRYLFLGSWLAVQPASTHAENIVVSAKNEKNSTIPEKRFKPLDIILFDDPILKILPPDFEPPPTNEWDHMEEVSEIDKKIHALEHTIANLEAEILFLKNSIAEMRSLSDHESLTKEIRRYQNSLHPKLRVLNHLYHTLNHLKQPNKKSSL